MSEIAELLRRADEYLAGVRDKSDPGPHHLVSDLAAHIRASAWTCRVRAAGKTDPPQDCDWPACGCDPVADKVLEAMDELLSRIEKRAKPCNQV